MFWVSERGLNLVDEMSVAVFGVFPPFYVRIRMLMNGAKTMRTFDSFIEVVPKIKKTSEFLLCT